MNVWGLFKPSAVLEILSYFTHNSGTIFSTRAGDTIFLQGSSKVDILWTCSFQFCVRLSLKCNDECSFSSCMQSLRVQAELSQSYILPLAFSQLCVRGIPLLWNIHHILFTSLKKLLKSWGFCQYDPTMAWAGTLSRSPGSSGWTAATPTSVYHSLPNTRWVKKQSKEIFLKKRKLCKFQSPLGFYQLRLFIFLKCVWFSVN